MVDASTPRPAASLMLLRDGVQGLEVLVGRRGEHVRAFPGATVFPGGKVEDADRLWSGAGEDARVAAAHAALRETFEETGLLVCASGEGAPRGSDVAAMSAAVEDGRLAFPDLLARWNRSLDLARLRPFSRWVTPLGAPYRFDTWFFAAAASRAEAEAALICAEMEALRWARPADLLTEAGLRLIFVTRRNLELLAESASAEEALAAAARRGVYEGRPAAAPEAFGGRP
jgi:8-oxo-dGTP pyrophosphatase MutT (NUDIX family)